MSSTIENQEVVIVMPAYNAGKTIAKTISDIPQDLKQHIVIVDDSSTDETVTKAEGMGFEVIKHTKNLGYGGNQKTCYREALKLHPKYIVMLHPDGQYLPQDLPKFIEALGETGAGAVFGNRMSSWKESLKAGMPWWKVVSNVLLSKIANLVTKQNLGEWHCGYRAYKASVLRELDISKLDNGFAFDVQLAILLLNKGVRIIDVQIKPIYGNENSSIKFWPSVRYGFLFLSALAKYKFSK